MFTQVLQQHKERKAASLADIDLKEREAQAAIESHASFVLDRLNSGAATVYANQQRIEAEAAQLQMHSARLAVVTQRWLKMYNGFNDALKELGDVRDWANAIETELDGVVQKVEFVLDAKQAAALKSSNAGNNIAAPTPGVSTSTNSGSRS